MTNPLISFSILTLTLFPFFDRKVTSNENQKTNHTYVASTTREIIAEVVSLSPFKLSSSEILEVDNAVYEDRTPTYGYVLNTEANRYPGWGITQGYFFDAYSGCFVYGTLYEGDNGVSLFVPCGPPGCVGFSAICPPEDGAFVRMQY